MVTRQKQGIFSVQSHFLRPKINSIFLKTTFLSGYQIKRTTFFNKIFNFNFSLKSLFMPCVLMHGQKFFVQDKSKFVPDKIIFVQKKIFCPRLKSHVRSFWKTKEFFSHLKSPFLFKKSHFKELFKSRNGLFSHGQNILSWTKLSRTIQDLSQTPQESLVKSTDLRKYHLYKGRLYNL